MLPEPVFLQGSVASQVFEPSRTSSKIMIAQVYHAIITQKTDTEILILLLLLLCNTQTDYIKETYNIKEENIKT